MGGHNRAKSKGDFCAVAAQPSCGCSIDADYVAVCRPSWGDYAFKRKIKGVGKRDKVFEAHHVLCAASVGEMIVDASGKGVAGIVRETEWCINTEKNMLAMPLWGHTVQWYCDVKNRKLGAKTIDAPPFADIPQHDWDHTGTGAYQSEVNERLRKIVKDLKQAGHEASSYDLAGALDDASSHFKSQLQSRGKRGGGTHDGWNKGRNAPTSQWYPPFSMASTGCVTGKGYPKLDFNDEFMAKLKWLARQLR